MIVSPYVFKSKAVRALKGNWQTALLVSFCASLPLTLTQLFQTTRLPDPAEFASVEALRAALLAVPTQTWVLQGVLGVLSLLVTPVLAVSCAHYFLRRIRGEELGFAGLFSRMPQFGKALLLYLLMAVKTLLWSLLLVVPGVMAALRYAMAPYYLAQDPNLTAVEALRKSKEAMRAQKGSLFMLELSFVAWLLAALLMQTLLMGLSPILALVVSQFIQLAMATYLNAATAAFYLAVSTPAGLERAQADASAWLRRAGMPVDMGRPFGNDDNEDGEDEPPTDGGVQDEPTADGGGDAPLPPPDGDTQGEPAAGKRAPSQPGQGGAGAASAAAAPKATGGADAPYGEGDGGSGGSDGEDH